MDFHSDTEKSSPKTGYEAQQPGPPPAEPASIPQADDGDLEALLQAAERLAGMAARRITPEVHKHVSSLGQRAREKQGEQRAGPGC